MLFICRSSTAKHCHYCCRCVPDFDHHCVWVNNCITGKNYKFHTFSPSLPYYLLNTTSKFIAFLSSYTLLYLFIISTDIAALTFSFASLGSKKSNTNIYMLRIHLSFFLSYSLHFSQTSWFSYILYLSLHTISRTSIWLRWISDYI